ncbi:calcium channel flower isoform X2 [Lycorma delicatula]|uniref:calcium channel flower isoform X2 n=1 Tax=Lycorma delicatula TaxID=130591 RepID=UPI003F51169E
MSFSEKIASLMQRPNEDLVPKDEVPWWMKYGGRGLGTVGGGLAIIFGLWNCSGILFINFGCAFAGLWQMVSGFIVIVIEAPCCCFFIDFVQTLSDFMEKRPYWNKAVLYMGFAIPPIVFCIGPTSFFGSALIFATGVIYGLMALGKKGSQQDMAAMASPTGATPQGDHHTTLMEDPDVWRPT